MSNGTSPTITANQTATRARLHIANQWPLTCRVRFSSHYPTLLPHVCLPLSVSTPLLATVEKSFSALWSPFPFSPAEDFRRRAEVKSVSSSDLWSSLGRSSGALALAASVPKKSCPSVKLLSVAGWITPESLGEGDGGCW